MPDILITPGTFNPPAALGEVHGLLAFPRVPVQPPKRVPLQWHSSYGEDVGPPALPSHPVTFIRRDYFTGQCLIGSNSENTETDNDFTLTGSRYVPDADYTATTINRYPGGAGYAIEIDPWARQRQIIELGMVPMNLYLVPGEFGLVGFASLMMPLNYNVQVLAANDAPPEAYEVFTRQNGTEWVAGTGGTANINLMLWREGVIPGGHFDIDHSIVFQLRKYGAILDEVFVSLRIRGEATPTGEPVAVGSRDEAITYLPAEYGVPETLYGGEVISPVISGPETPIYNYSRSSYALQGTITFP